jgi:hypothetical protein
MSDAYPDVEFLDPAEGDPNSVEWLGEESLGARGGTFLPRRTTARRVFGSLAVFALGLSVIGYPGLGAYRHDQAVAAEANDLMLQAVDVGDAVTLTDPAQLGGSGRWRVDPSASIAISVTNESPDPITLLPGSTLVGAGLTQPAALAPSGTTRLRPGQSGRLTGTATVDCGVRVQNSAAPANASPPAPAPAPAPAPGNSVLVQARTASGAVGTASLGVGKASTSAVRDQICAAQGGGLAASFFPESVDAAKHTFTVAVDAHSLSAQPLRYLMQAAFDSGGGQTSSAGADLTIRLSDGEPVTSGLSLDAVDQLLPGVRLSAVEPVGPVQGVLSPDDTIDAGFTVHVLSCPSAVPTAQADVTLDMYLDYRGQPAYFQADSFDLGVLVAAACDMVA